MTDIHVWPSRWWDVEQELGQLWLDDLGEKEKTWEPSMDSTYMQGGAYILSKVRQNFASLG